MTALVTRIEGIQRNIEDSSNDVETIRGGSTNEATGSLLPYL